MSTDSRLRTNYARCCFSCFLREKIIYQEADNTSVLKIHAFILKISPKGNGKSVFKKNSVKTNLKRLLLFILLVILLWALIK
jgi:hypothetical protein